MSKQPTHDICRICGEHRPMTFEHVPARSAGNADARFTHTLAETWAKKAGRPARYRQEQRGAGEYALCDECQRLCNHRGYVREYGIWTRVGLTLLRALGEGDERDVVGVNAAMRNVRPGRFCRQVVANLLTINRPAFGDDHPHLREYVRNEEAVALPERYRLYLSLYDGYTAWYAGGFGVLDPPMRTCEATEISYRPFTFTLTIDDTAPPPVAGDITELARTPPSEPVDVRIRLPIGQSALPHDLDAAARPEEEQDA